MDPVWKGSHAIHEQPHSPKRMKTASGLVITRVFRGPFSALVAEEPQVGATMEGTADVRVVSVETVPDGAGPLGPGTMTVIASNESTAGDVVDDTSPPVYEMEWAALEKPLENHPRYQTGGLNALTIADLTDVDNWKNEADRAKKAAFTYVKSDGSDVVLSANAQHLAARLARGFNSYIVPAPVARRTTRSSFKPNTSAQGKRQNPPAGTGFPAGYEWLKTADRAVRQGARGKWERTEEWTGADFWDHDTYLAAT